MLNSFFSSSNNYVFSGFSPSFLLPPSFFPSPPPCHVYIHTYNHRPDSMLVLEINSIVGFVANYLCLVLGQWHPTPVLLPGKSHGRRSLVGYSPWGRWGSDTTERLHFHFSLSCIGEGNGKPLQCSCLENPRDGGAWWAAVYGVAQSWTQLMRLSSSS